VSEGFTYRLRTRYAECDPQGVVLKARSLAFDSAMTGLRRERGEAGVGPAGEG
jgi:acyl-CoA thioesterase FadM